MRDALGLLTTLGRRGGSLNPRALAWFPVVGLTLGVLLGAWWWAAARWWPAAVAAVLVVAADLALTGLLHVDGLADSADGLLPHASRDRRLAIMREPGVGAFGATAVALVLVARTVALASRTPSVWLIAATWCATRAFVASVPAHVAYARDDGIASPLVPNAPRWPAIAAGGALLLAAATDGVAGAVAVSGAVATAAAVVAIARRRLGGFTGDVLGAAIVLGETVALVAAAGRW